MTFSVLLECSSEEKEILIGTLWEFGTTGVVERDLSGRILLRAFFEGESNRDNLLRRLAEFKPQWAEEEDRDWVQEAQDSWGPRLVGERFFLVPRWRDDPTPVGRLRLEINPGLAYGTGEHPSTQLALEAMEGCLKAGERVLDLGTGSGILARGARLLGAGAVLACDTDPEAVEVARKSLASAGLFVGSAHAVRSKSIDLLVANIDAATIDSLALELKRVLKPSGTAIFSGFTRQDLDAGRLRLTPREILESGEWICAITRRPFLPE